MLHGLGWERSLRSSSTSKQSSVADGRTDLSVHEPMYSLRISVPQPPLLQVPKLLHLRLVLFEDG